MKPACFRVVALFLLTIVNAPAADDAPAILPRQVITSVDGRNLVLTLAIFSHQEFSLRVIDNAAPNDTARFARLRLATRALGAAAGCNGGFFNRKPFDPVGLMIADGVHAGTFDAKSWMQGLIVVRDGDLRLESAKSFQDTPAVTQAIQSGPWLVRAGTTEPSTDARVARRTFICRDATGRWALGASEPCTLGQLAAALCSEDVASALVVDTALNLDGGPSTGLWVGGGTEDFSLPDQWAVRNYVALFPREPAARQ